MNPRCANTHMHITHIQLSLFVICISIVGNDQPPLACFSAITPEYEVFEDSSSFPRELLGDVAALDQGLDN